MRVPTVGPGGPIVSVSDAGGGTEGAPPIGGNSTSSGRYVSEGGMGRPGDAETTGGGAESPAERGSALETGVYGTAVDPGGSPSIASGTPRQTNVPTAWGIDRQTANEVTALIQMQRMRSQMKYAIMRCHPQPGHPQPGHPGAAPGDASAAFGPVSRRAAPPFPNETIDAGSCTRLTPNCCPFPLHLLADAIASGGDAIGV